MRVIVFVAALLLTGCASITSESMQLVRVDAVDETGEKVTDARCTLTNDKGEFVTEAGKHARVGKSSKNLNVTCTATDRTDEATGTLISRAGAGMFGNIIFGGGIGAIIDPELLPEDARCRRRCGIGGADPLDQRGRQEDRRLRLLAAEALE